MWKDPKLMFWIELIASLLTENEYFIQNFGQYWHYFTVKYSFFFFIKPILSDSKWKYSLKNIYTESHRDKSSSDINWFWFQNQNQNVWENLHGTMTNDIFRFQNCFVASKIKLPHKSFQIKRSTMQKTTNISKCLLNVGP